MKFLSSVMKLVRRKRPYEPSTGVIQDHPPKSRHPEEQFIGAGKFRCPVLWKSSDGKWHRHQLSVRRASDSSFWFSLTRMGAEQALHSSNQLMHVSHDRKGVLHLIFVSGVLSLRFPTNLQTQQYLAWAAASAIRSTGNMVAGKLIRGAEQKNRRREVRIITKDASMVIMDVKRQCPLLFTTAQLIRAVSVSGSAVALLSAIPGNDHFLHCDGGRDLRTWHDLNMVKKQRQKITRRISKPRSRVGRPRMGVLATRRNRISEASFERIVRRKS